MGAAFVVTLREAFEAALLLGVVYTSLDKVGGRVHFRWVTLGAVLGLVASAGAGVAVTLLSGPLMELGPDVVALVILFVAVGLLTWHGWWMRRHARAIKGEVQRRIDQARASRRVWVVALIAFTGVFREGAETVLFLWGLMSQADVAGWSGLAGGTLGVVVAALLGLAIFRGGRQLSLPLFFGVTSVLLMIVAAGLFAGGIGKLEGLGWLPGSDPVWDTSALLADDSALGGFVGGLAGYRARPSLAEVLAYAGYLLVVGALYFTPRAAAHGPGSAARRRRGWWLMLGSGFGPSERDVRAGLATGAWRTQEEHANWLDAQRTLIQPAGETTNDLAQQIRDGA